MNINKNWEGFTDLSHPNWTAITRSRSRRDDYDGIGGWAKDSKNPPWGWPIAWALGLAVVGLLLFGPTLAARIIGL